MKLTLILIGIILFLGFAIYLLIKKIQKQKNEIQCYKNKIDCLSNNIKELSKYIDKITKIDSEKNSNSQMIKEAESDEEVYKIIADIIADNNNIVQNYKN